MCIFKATHVVLYHTIWFIDCILSPIRYLYNTILLLYCIAITWNSEKYNCIANNRLFPVWFDLSVRYRHVAEIRSYRRSWPTSHVHYMIESKRLTLVSREYYCTVDRKLTLRQTYQVETDCILSTQYVSSYIKLYVFVSFSFLY